jgi:hypothetical protein
VNQGSLREFGVTDGGGQSEVRRGSHFLVLGLTPNSEGIRDRRAGGRGQHLNHRGHGGHRGIRNYRRRGLGGGPARFSVPGAQCHSQLRGNTRSEGRRQTSTPYPQGARGARGNSELQTSGGQPRFDGVLGSWCLVLTRNSEGIEIGGQTAEVNTLATDRRADGRRQHLNHRGHGGIRNYRCRRTERQASTLSDEDAERIC